MPRVRRVALQPLYAARDLRRAVVVDKTLPAVRQWRRRDDVQLFRREGCCWCVRCCRLAGPRVAPGDVGQQAHWPRRYGSHGDGHYRGRQCRAVRRPVLPKSRGVPGEVPAGRSPGHYPAVRAVRFAASSLLHLGGGVERGPLQQRLRALPCWEGGRGRLREALRAQALWVRVVRVLPAVLRGHMREGKELVLVPVALPGGRVVECQPLFHHASGVCGLNAALQSQAGQVV